LNAVNVEIPVKAKLRFDVADSFKAYVEAGLGLGFNCRDLGKDSYSFYWVDDDEDVSYVDCTNQYRPLQLSMIFGLGTEYEISRNLTAFAQLTFDHAFSNAFISSLEKQTGSIVRNNYIGIEVGIMY
jgi:opacity protein-like surface antigen